MNGIEIVLIAQLCWVMLLWLGGVKSPGLYLYTFLP